MSMGDSIDKIFEAKGLKARIKQASFVIACVAAVTIAGVGMNSCGNAQEAERQQIAALIPSNYSVDAVGTSDRNFGFTGYTFSVATGGVVHRCGGITKEEVLAKKPLTCIDGWTINAKK